MRRQRRAVARPGSTGRRGARRRRGSRAGCPRPGRADCRARRHARSSPRRTSRRTTRGRRRTGRARPSGLAGVEPHARRRRRSVRPAAARRPTGSGAPSRPPRAAFSHSASVGSRAPAHAANAAASSHETPTTGWSGASKPGARQNAGGGAPVAAEPGRPLGVRHRRRRDGEGVHPHARARGRSPGCPASQPIVNGPPATSTKSTRL